VVALLPPHGAHRLSGVDPALAKVTVGEWVQRWLDGQAHLKATTRSRYEGVQRQHIHPQWDRVKLATSPTATSRPG
jgi:hypothetical protein